jgi:AraC family transcriptional regulator of adaptative response / DNA-3-methyladenine glycosylase II
LLAEDLVIKRELHRRGIEPSDHNRWAPWRSYATMRLWQSSTMELAA